MPKRGLPERSESACYLADRITKFMNAAFGRKLGRMGPSRNLIDAAQAALDAGYGEKEIRMAYWAARCVPKMWIASALAESMQPEVVLRHKGGMNSTTGKPAKRWLDDLLDEVGEINPRLATAILNTLPEDMRDEERKLLRSVGIAVDE